MMRARVSSCTRSTAASAVRPVRIASAEPLAPALVVREQAIGFDHLARFPGESELRGFEHLIDRIAQLIERAFQALEFGRGIVGDHAVDLDARLVQEDRADDDAFGEAFAAEVGRPRRRKLGLVDLGEIDQRSLRHDLRQDHGDGGERLFFLLVVVARGAVLHREHAEHPFAAHDRHGEERMERIFAGFRPVGETRMLGRVGEIQRRRRAGDQADKALALLQPRAVNRLAVQALGREELQLAACPAQIDRADFRDHVGRDDRNQFVEASLGALPLRHDLAQAAQKNPGAAGYELRRHQMAFPAIRRICVSLLIRWAPCAA